MASGASRVAQMVKESTCNARDVGLIPESGRSPGGGHGNPLQCFCLENPTDRGAWWTAVHGVTQSQTQWSSSQYCDFRGPRWAVVTHSVSLETGILDPESKGLRSHPLSPAAQLFIPLVTNVLLCSAQVLPEKGRPGLSGEEKVEAPFPLNVELQGTYQSKSTAQVLPLQCQPPPPSLTLLPAQVSFLLCFSLPPKDWGREQTRNESRESRVRPRTHGYALGCSDVRKVRMSSHMHTFIFSEGKLENRDWRDFPRGPVATTACSPCRGPRFPPGSGTKLPRAAGNHLTCSSGDFTGHN